MSAALLRRNAVLVAAALAARVACARIGTLEGGPADREPPHLLHVTPADSTVNLSRRPRFVLEWSEPLGSSAARSAVRIVPFVRFDAEAHGEQLRIEVQ